jgi:site-specific DNA recombinase
VGGDWADVGEIRKAFKASNTVVITPHKVLDYNDEKQELANDMDALMAKHEYRLIKGRLKAGKIIGAKRGRWTNGVPPFPYFYDRNTKSLVVDEAKLPIYRMMVEEYLNGTSLKDIAVKVNKMGVKTHIGKYWSEVKVERVIFSEIHLGRIIYGKTSGSGHKNKPTKPLEIKDRDEWIIVENCHTAIKTLEEHSRMLAIKNAKQKVPKRARNGVYALSGLIKCSKCGYSMRMNNKKTVTKGLKCYVVKCQKTDPFGNQCGHHGIDADILLEAIENELLLYLNEIKSFENPQPSNQYKLDDLLAEKRKELKNAEDGLNRIYNLYVMGKINEEVMNNMSKEQEAMVIKIKNELREIEENFKEVKGISKEERKERIEAALRGLSDNTIETKELNRLLRLIIKEISYKKVQDEVTVEISFY